ncbi:MAG: hypothetical protein Q8K86_02075 [Candidatus Nanopelagicaceae bacterium]|nr:hypothetical protein [Candidatus Nanopelagicaceae bacterium]
MAKFKKSTQMDIDRDLEKLLSVLKAFQVGEHSQRMPTDRTGV